MLLWGEAPRDRWGAAMALLLPIQVQRKPNLLIFRFIKKVIERGIVNTAVTFRISTGTLNRFGLLQGELHHQQALWINI